MSRQDTRSKTGLSRLNLDVWSLYVFDGFFVLLLADAWYFAPFAGFVGLWCALVLWPGFFILHYSQAEEFQLPDKKQWLLILTNGLVGTVLSEFLWLW